MKLSRRVGWLLLFFGAALPLGFLFRDFIAADILIPIALFLLLCWRLLLSVHQAFFWGVVIALALGLAFYHLVQAAWRAEEPSATELVSVTKVIDHWRLPLELASGEGVDTFSLKQELRHMLVAMFAAKQAEAEPFAIFDALRLRQLPLPDPLHSFLFGDEAHEPNPSWRQRLQYLAAKPGLWLRRWTGRVKAEHYRAMEETLTFMEELMEINHGDNFFDPSHH